MSTAPQLNVIKTEKTSIKKTWKNLSAEDLEIVTILEKLKIELDHLHNSLNQVTDMVLIDSYIYEINAIYMRYKYYLTLCKKRNLIADGFN